MKKMVCLLLAVCMIMSWASLALAAEEITYYVNDHYNGNLPAGYTIQNGGGTNGTVTSDYNKGYLLIDKSGTNNATVTVIKEFTAISSGVIRISTKVMMDKLEPQHVIMLQSSAASSSTFAKIYFNKNNGFGFEAQGQIEYPYNSLSADTWYMVNVDFDIDNKRLTATLMDENNVVLGSSTLTTTNKNDMKKIAFTSDASTALRKMYVDYLIVSSSMNDSSVENEVLHEEIFSEESLDSMWTIQNGGGANGTAKVENGNLVLNKTTSNSAAVTAIWDFNAIENKRVTISTRFKTDNFNLERDIILRNGTSPFFHVFIRTSAKLVTSDNASTNDVYFNMKNNTWYGLDIIFDSGNIDTILKDEAGNVLAHNSRTITARPVSGVAFTNTAATATQTYTVDYVKVYTGDIAPVAENAELDAQSNTISFSCDYTSPIGENVSNSIITWYKSDSKKGGLVKINGINGTAYNAAYEDDGKYFVVTVTPVDEKDNAGKTVTTGRFLFNFDKTIDVSYGTLSESQLPVTIKGYTTQTISAVSAVYNGDVLEDCVIQPLTITDSEQTFNIDFGSLNLSEGKNIKVFLFDSMKKLVPITSVHTITFQ